MDSRPLLGYELVPAARLVPAVPIRRELTEMILTKVSLVNTERPKGALVVTGTGVAQPYLRRPQWMVRDDGALVALLVWLLLNRTTYGRRLYGVGSNDTAATFAGLEVARTRFHAFAISGLLAGISAVTITAYYHSARPDAANRWYSRRSRSRYSAGS